MAQRSAIIIGAGLAGLATGCYAQANGYWTRIYEQHTRAGGVCTAWKRKGYTVDGCIRWLPGARPGSVWHELYREVGALEGVRLRPLDRLRSFVDERSGQHLEVTADLDRLAAEMKALSPEDGPAVDALIAGARAVREVDAPSGRPAWLAQWMQWGRERGGPVSRLADRFQSPFLRWVLRSLLAPEMPARSLFVLLAQLAAGGLATVEGGSLAFSLAIARRYRALGGEMVYGAPVEEVLVEAGHRWRGARHRRAAGVRLADGTTHHAGAVVSAADGYSTIYELLGGRYVGRAVRARYETWPLYRPLLMVSFGVAGGYPDRPPEQTVRLAQPLTVAGRPVGSFLYRTFGSETAAAPGGVPKTVVQSLIETDFAYWRDLHEDRPRYEAEKARLADEVLARLDAHLPGLAARVEMTDVATPYTAWRYTRNREGAYRGWRMTPDRLRAPPSKTLPGLDDFYMAGQWVEPGGGVPQALASGRQVVQLMCRRDGVRFAAPTG